MDRGTAMDRSRTRWRHALATCALALLAAAAVAGAGCGGDDSGREQAAAAAAARRAAAARALAAQHARELPMGRRVFAKHCQSCHTLNGKKFTGPVIEFVAPNLDEVKPKRKYVQYRVTSGGPAMASFQSEIPERGFRAVVTYITEVAGRNVPAESSASDVVLRQGEEVFASHCAVCHGIAGRAASGRPVYPGTDFNLVKPSVRFVLQRLHEGVLDELEAEGKMMPSFRGRLSEADLKAVAEYVSATAAEGPEAPTTPFEP